MNNNLSYPEFLEFLLDLTSLQLHFAWRWAHLDGHQCLCHLDHLLAIEPLDAIEWTPDPTVPGGGSPEWYPLYRRILGAGKSVQAIGVKPDEVIPLLDAVGGKGIYISVNTGGDRAAFEGVAERAEAYR